MSKRKPFEILCVTMHQNDLSKIAEMNLHADVIFANQAEETSDRTVVYDGVHTARMITTDTRGVGKNRNIALTYASAEYCLLADDDVVYRDDVEQTVVQAFQAHPDADLFVFHLESDDPQRAQRAFAKTRKYRRWERLSFGGIRIAFRLDSVRKANLWFTTLFGGGCVFPSGEDSLWLMDARRAGLTFYVSDRTIGSVSFKASTWFTGYDEKFYYGKGAFYAAAHAASYPLWALYFALRTHKNAAISLPDRFRWMRAGREGYRTLTPFEAYQKSREERV